MLPILNETHLRFIEVELVVNSWCVFISLRYKIHERLVTGCEVAHAPINSCDDHCRRVSTKLESDF